MIGMTYLDDTIDATFPNSYECRLLRESPVAALPHYYYPGGSTQGGQDGILVEIHAEQGERWLATFAFGQVTSKGGTGVFANPDP